MYNINRRSPPLRITPVAVADQSSTDASSCVLYGHTSPQSSWEVLCVGNQVSVAILLGVGCESHDAVHALYKRRFSQDGHAPSLLILFLCYLENQSNPRLISPCKFLMINLVVSSAC